QGGYRCRKPKFTGSSPQAAALHRPNQQFARISPLREGIRRRLSLNIVQTTVCDCGVRRTQHADKTYYWSYVLIAVCGTAFFFNDASAATLVKDCGWCTSTAQA